MAGTTGPAGPAAGAQPERASANGAADPGYGIAPPGYRLPPGTAVGRVRLQVAELERSVRYYQAVLGLQELAREPGRSELGVRPDAVPLLELRERPGAAPVPRSGRLGLYHFAVLLPERASLGRFLAHLARLGVHAGMADHLVSEAVYLRDPDGLGIEVYADRPRAAWRHSGRELRMDTAPLDVPDLLRAAQAASVPGGAPAPGAPAADEGAERIARGTGADRTPLAGGGAAPAPAAGEDAWRMPPGTRMGHLHLYVGDLGEAAAFYHAALGLDRTVWSYPGALFFSAGGYHHHLGVNTWAARAPRAGEADARLLEWELELPTAAAVEAAADSLARAGQRVQTSPAGITVADPWGTVLRLRPAAAG